MTLRYGADTPDAIYLGADRVDRIYLGEEQVWPAAAPALPYSRTFTVTAGLLFQYTNGVWAGWSVTTAGGISRGGSISPTPRNIRSLGVYGPGQLAVVQVFGGTAAMTVELAVDDAAAIALPWDTRTLPIPQYIGGVFTPWTVGQVVRCTISTNNQHIIAI